MEDDIVAKLIPIIVITVLAAIPISIQYFNYLKRKAALETVRLMVERAETIDERVLTAIAAGPPRRYADLRRGLLLIGVALSGALVCFAVGAMEARRIGFAILSLPFFLGLIHLGFHFFLPRDADQ